MPDHQMDSQVVNMDMRNIMELRDGGILANVQLFNEIQGDYGCMFYKIEYDSSSVAIADSLFIEDNDMNSFLLERNPLDDDNVFAKIVRNFDGCRSDLRISFFDDGLNFKPEKEVWIPIVDTLISPLADNYMLDKSGNLVFRYSIKSRKEFHVVKMSLDGNEKAHIVIPFDELPFNNSIQLGTFNELSNDYFLGGIYTPALSNPNNHGKDTLRIMLLDSLLNFERTIEHNTPPNRYNFIYNTETYLENYKDTTFLVFSKCDTLWCTQVAPDTLVCPPNAETWDYDGVCLSKCGKSTAQTLASWIKGVTNTNTKYPMGVKKAKDGSIYIAFENSGVTVVKFASDLSTLWESRRGGGVQYFPNMVALENGGVAVGGMNYDDSSELVKFFMVIFKDGCFSVPETKAEESPYTFYPNPANEELNLNIASDAEPSMIELYDIQGRMVRSQENNFEKVSLRGLPAGTYALRVSLKNGKRYTSTVVKR